MEHFGSEAGLSQEQSSRYVK